MIRIAPIDIPDDIIEAMAKAGRRDTAQAADFICWMAGREQDVCVDFSLERFLDRLGREIALGRYDVADR